MTNPQLTSYSVGKAEIFPTKIWKKTRVPTLTTPIQLSNGNPSKRNYSRKRNKRYPN